MWNPEFVSNNHEIGRDVENKGPDPPILFDIKSEGDIPTVDTRQLGSRTGGGWLPNFAATGYEFLRRVTRRKATPLN